MDKAALLVEMAAVTEGRGSLRSIDWMCLIQSTCLLLGANDEVMVEVRVCGKIPALNCG